MSEILVVASKVKGYIKEKGGCNTSASTMDAVTALVTKILDKSIENAKADGRKTVMDKDIPNIEV
jgi:histone H3/H4